MDKNIKENDVKKKNLSPQRTKKLFTVNSKMDEKRYIRQTDRQTDRQEGERLLYW